MAISMKKVFKHSRKDPLSDNRSLKELASISSKAAIRASLGAGIPVTYVKDGYIVQELPGHEIRRLRKLTEEPEFDIKEYLCQSQGQG